GFAYVMAQDDHISVDFLISKTTGTAGTIMRILILTFMITILTLVVIGLWHMFHTAIVNNITMPSAVPIPRAVPIGTGLVGVLLFDATIILRIIERLAAGTYPHPKEVFKIE